jgi:hypothetical protein
MPRPTFTVGEALLSQRLSAPLLAVEPLAAAADTSPDDERFMRLALEGASFQSDQALRT